MEREESKIDELKRRAVGLSFILFPFVFIFAFAGHPDLLRPRFLSPEELILRAHGNGMLHLGHALVTLCTGLLVVVALQFMNIQKGKSSAWYGWIGGGLAILGALMLAADKGALCLTMSALDALPEAEFANMMPGLLAMFAKKGWLVLIWGLLLLPAGFVIQIIGLIKTKQLPTWQSLLFLVGVLFIGVPDGVEIVNLTASVLVAIAMVPYGIGLARSGKPAMDRPFSESRAIEESMKVE
ncbi:MAG: hypothetical protein ACYTFG_01210 [Planctomycetota bacterium]|jgi:hypothetical protein